jgi:hypothetical protein
MMDLGALGRQLSEVVEADLSRVARARSSEDLLHAKLAAEDLAARLHQPDPSFEAQGGSGLPNQPSGQRQGSPSQKGDKGGESSPDGTQRGFDESLTELDELSREHRGATSKTRSALGDGPQGKGSALDPIADEEEGLADRARELAEKAHESLPEEAADAIDDAERAARKAAKALKQGDGVAGLDRQQEAQRHLEAARERLEGDDDEGPPPAPNGDGNEAAGEGGRVAIPGAGEQKGPEDFRLRVTRGLGRPAGSSLRDAVRRYAAGLLQ